jgi:hypothetical protein
MHNPIVCDLQAHRLADGRAFHGEYSRSRSASRKQDEAWAIRLSVVLAYLRHRGREIKTATRFYRGSQINSREQG